jgi:acetate---CoA ligase (ADP-forming)
MKSLIEAESLAVVGASDDVTRIGGRPIEYSHRNGFKGRLYPVNPKRDTVQGLRAYPSLADLPETVDVAIIAVPRQHVLEAIKGANAHNYVIFSAGYGEMGAEGKTAQAVLAREIRAQGGRMLGPNCLGFINRSTRLVASFTPTFETLPAGPRSNVAILTQSGAFGSYLYSLAVDRGLVVQEYVSTGNEGDVTVVDLVEYYAERPDIDVIATQFEGVQALQLQRALERIDASGKLLVVCKAGRTNVGARAAASHTGSLVGDDAAFDAILRGHRVVRRQSADEMIDMLSAASVHALPMGKRVAIAGVSGGSAVLMADEAVELGLDLPDIPERAKQVMRERVEFCTPANPLDMTAQVINDAKIAEEALGALLESAEFDAVLLNVGAGPLDATLAGRWLTCAQLLRQSSKIPFLMSGMSDDSFRDAMRALAIPLFRDPVRLVRTVAALAEAARPLPKAANWVLDSSPVRLEEMDEYGLKRYFEGCGIKVPAGQRAATPEAAVEVAQSLGFPVAIKLAAGALKHKSDIGGVVLNIRTPEEAASAAERLMATARRACISGAGLLVERQTEPGPELIISVKRDPVYGVLLVVGFGGVLTEILQDVAVEVLPSNDVRLASALRRLRGWRVFEGYRGSAHVQSDVIISGVREIACAAEPLLRDGAYAEIELNPVFVRPGGLWVIDATAYEIKTASA